MKTGTKNKLGIALLLAALGVGGAGAAFAQGAPSADAARATATC